MNEEQLNSLQRVLTTLNHKEPDRLPFFLFLTMHGAKELGLSIKQYFSRGENVAAGQLIMREKYRHDCLYPFFYAAIEIEAWGGEVIYCDHGPPNSGKPFIRRSEDIISLKKPSVKKAPCLEKVLKATQILKDKTEDDVPLIGVVMSPFSLPVMQMGFSAYIDLIYEQPQLFEHLLKVNEEFCIEWANAQLEAGATAICYFDPVSSPTVIPRELFLKTGYLVAERVISCIQGPTAVHFASGSSLPVADDVIRTGAEVIGVSSKENLQGAKETWGTEITLLGNLNGIEMVRWDKKQAAASVKKAIYEAAPDGGFILADNHGEIPWQVPEEILMTISETVHEFGKYPLDRRNISYE